MSLLGKRKTYVNQWMSRNAGKYRGAWGPSTGTRYRSARRVFRRRGPYRTGGFYGASMRPRMERKVVDVAIKQYIIFFGCIYPKCRICNWNQKFYKLILIQNLAYLI